MERKNKWVGQIATAAQNTAYFESSILEEMISTELAMVIQADAFDQSCGLVKPRQVPKKLLPIALFGQGCKSAKAFSHPAMPKSKMVPFVAKAMLFW